MRYRQLVDGDMTFGQGGRNFYVDEPAAVAQAILTRLRLEVGEWFLDVTEGTPYLTKILGYGSAASRDVALRNRILGTEGVISLESYTSALDVNRRLSVSARAETAYGLLTIEITTPVDPTGPGQLDWSITGNILVMVVS